MRYAGTTQAPQPGAQELQKRMFSMQGAQSQGSVTPSCRLLGSMDARSPSGQCDENKPKWCFHPEILFPIYCRRQMRSKRNTAFVLLLARTDIVLPTATPAPAAPRRARFPMKPPEPVSHLPTAHQLLTMSNGRQRPPPLRRLRLLGRALTELQTLLPIRQKKLLILKRANPAMPSYQGKSFRLLLLLLSHNALLAAMRLLLAHCDYAPRYSAIAS